MLLASCRAVTGECGKRELFECARKPESAPLGISKRYISMAHQVLAKHARSFGSSLCTAVQRVCIGESDLKETVTGPSEH